MRTLLHHFLPLQPASRYGLMVLPMLLVACATQQSVPPSQAPLPAPSESAQVLTAPPTGTASMEALKTLVQMQDRLDRIAAPLLLKNADLCKTQARNLLGFTAKNRYSYSSEFTDAASNLFGLQERLQVIGVLGGSGAALVGIKPGDVLLKAEDKDLPQGQNAERIAATILAPMVSRKASVKMSVLRNGEALQLNVPLTRACGFRVELGNADNVASYADGARIMITRGMLGFSKSDEEVAFLIAKEMAHNALSHPAKNRSYSAMAAMIDNLIQVKPDLSLLITGGGIKAYPLEMDAASDHLALYMLARAGYSIENTRLFWQRLADQYPQSVLSSHTALHPNTSARITAMAKAASEIRSKQAAKKVLLP